ncbi:hypothetical protein, partial [Actinomyces wuliandei]|uniref:hypothetical protein n=1 Tax=Actinomyces wuliandei TaxID=2057743 RepID=UPI001119F3D9
MTRVGWSTTGEVPEERVVVAPPRRGRGLWPLRWVVVGVVLVTAWAGLVEVALLRWPVLVVAVLLAWEAVVRGADVLLADCGQGGVLRRVRG